MNKQDREIMQLWVALTAMTLLCVWFLGVAFSRLDSSNAQIKQLQKDRDDQGKALEQLFNAPKAQPKALLPLPQRIGEVKLK